MRENIVSVRQATAAVAVVVALCLVAGNAAAKAPSVKVKKDLASTGVEANARGKAKLSLRGGSSGKFEVKASHLEPNQSYDVIVRGVKISTLQTSGGGSGRASFSTKPGKHDSALGFDPRGAVVDVRDDSGDDVLVGDIPDDSVDPAEVACCVAQNNGEAECEDMTADASTAVNGVSAGVASCLPDPCGSSSVPESEIVCCTNQTGDDEGASECEDQNEVECAAAGGMAVQATSCDPNHCAPTPPSAETACCVTKPVTNEVECEVTTPESCTAQNGTAVAGGSCSTDPCGTGGSGL